jgi:hypothetical protein
MAPRPDDVDVGDVPFQIHADDQSGNRQLFANISRASGAGAFPDREPETIEKSTACIPFVFRKHLYSALTQSSYSSRPLGFSYAGYGLERGDAFFDPFRPESRRGFTAPEDFAHRPKLSSRLSGACSKRQM